MDLLDHHLSGTLTLLIIRKNIFSQFGDSRKSRSFIDKYVDPELLLDIDVITMKAAFAKEYLDPTALGLYKKDAKEVMDAFCRYRPKNLKIIRSPMSVIVEDCKKLTCAMCPLGLNEH